MNILKEDFLLKDKSELLIDSPLRMIIWLLIWWLFGRIQNCSCCFNPGVRHRFHTGHVSTSNDFRPLVQVGKLQTDLVQVPLGCTEIIFCRENAQIYGCNFDNMLNLDTIYTFSIWFLYYVYLYIICPLHPWLSHRLGPHVLLFAPDEAGSPELLGKSQWIAPEVPRSDLVDFPENPPVWKGRFRSWKNPWIY